MERLDYRINEDGIERWISHEKVMNILTFLYPAIAEEIEQKMRWDDKAFEYSWAGKKCRIEYKGPKPGSHKVSNLLTSLFLLSIVFMGTGCKRGLAERVFGPDTHHNDDPPSASYVLACCTDNVAGVDVYPSFLPAAHVQTCKKARAACHSNDCHMTGNQDVYLPMGVDCNPRFGHIGSEYYAGHPGY